MRTLFTLDKKGIGSALVLGLLLLIFGGISFLLIMLLFLVLSSFVTYYGVKAKSSMQLFEKSRSWKNVVANGIVPLFVSIAYYFNPSIELIFVYVVSVAAVTADKFASEIGVLDGIPRSILNFKKVKKGTSGGVTLLGIFASLLGSFLISIVLIPFGIYLVIISTILGLFGSIVDSIAGVFEEKGYGNKYTSNILCSLSASILAYLILLA